MKKIKIYFKALVKSLIVYLGFYAAFSFIFHESDSGNWTEFARILYILLSVTISILINILPDEKK